MMIAAPVAAAPMGPPSLRCTAVLNASGDVLITWVQPPDPLGEFQAYLIYHSALSTGPFTLVGQETPYLQLDHTHAGTGANNAPQYYYLRTLSTTSDTSITSDTLTTLFLDVSQSAPLGQAWLDWNLQHAPPLSTTEVYQEVELEFPIGTWAPLAQTDSVTSYYEHTIDICEDSLTFRVRVPDLSGCVSVSNLDGDVFADVTPPTPPFMVNLTVDTTVNQTVIDWQPSPEGDTDGYIVILVTPDGNIILDTLFGATNTTWVWPGSDAAEGAESYTIAAFDTCLTGNPPAPNTSATEAPHSTVFVTTTYDRCGSAINVVWTAYNGWIVQAYELYVRQDGAAPVLLGSFDPTVTTFLHENVDQFSTFCYVVRAVAQAAGLTSLSNTTCRVADYPPLPQWNYLRNVTVVDDDHIVVEDSVDLNGEVESYQLERSFNGEPWEGIAVVGATNYPVIVFNDLDVQTDLRSYQYRVSVLDSCGRPSVTSNLGTSILLRSTARADGVNELLWNAYVQWAGNISGYNVYRSISDGPFMLIATTPQGQWELEDDVNAYALASTGKFCYYVEALEVGNPSGVDAVSTSNVTCAVQQEAVWIPNAFIAGSPIAANSAFYPVLAYADITAYEFIIYNRWGQAIWTTTDRYEPWTGEVNGSYVPQGIYGYYCAFNNGAGKRIEARGTVTFLCCPE